MNDANDISNLTPGRTSPNWPPGQVHISSLWVKHQLQDVAAGGQDQASEEEGAGHHEEHGGGDHQ